MSNTIIDDLIGYLFSYFRWFILFTFFFSFFFHKLWYESHSVKITYKPQLSFSIGSDIIWKQSVKRDYHCENSFAGIGLGSESAFFRIG